MVKTRFNAACLYIKLFVTANMEVRVNPQLATVGCILQTWLLQFPKLQASKVGMAYI